MHFKSSFLAFLLPLALVSTGCDEGGPTPAPVPAPAPDFKAGYPLKKLIAPTDTARQAAVEFNQAFPSARIFFSQNTGDILWVDGGGLPLAQGLTDTPEHALAILQNFMIAHPGLYRISDPEHAFDALSTKLTISGATQGVVSLHFEELQDGAPIHGRYGTAIFDASGSLLSLQTHLAATADIQTAKSLPSGISAKLLRPAAPAGARRQWVDLEGTGKLRLIEEQVETSGVQVLRVFRDPQTGEVLKTRDETPSDLVAAPKGWSVLPEVSVAARDTLGKDLLIPSTQAVGALVLGFHLEGIHAQGMGASVGDAGSSPNPGVAPVTPIATDRPDWQSDSDFDSKLRAASTLASNLKTTLEWYKQNLGWASWDNKGTTIFTAIRGNRSGSHTPQLNAWGGGGMILIGDGLTETGQPLSDALDVVAHEFTHSVVYATTPLVYSDESGALNESLADIFGKTVQGFPDLIMGASAGGHFRDLADPEHCVASDLSSCQQPGLYSEYEVIPETIDNAGVHTNSGIANRALTQVIQSSPAGVGAASGLGPRSLALTSLLLDSLNQAGFDPSLDLEDFAAALLGYCQARQQATSLAPTQTGMCGQLETAFMRAQLLTQPLSL